MSESEDTVETEIVVEGRRVKLRARKERPLEEWPEPGADGQPARAGEGSGASGDRRPRGAEALAAVGHPVRRADGFDKVTGLGRYTHDQVPPGALVARALRSPHARARVAAIQTQSALRVPGVHCILTPADVEDYRLGGQPILASEPAFAGEEIAVVAAGDDDAAEEALRRIRVTWDPLPGAVGLDDALAPGAPRLDRRGNVVAAAWEEPKFGEPARYQRGDPDGALSRAAVQLERTYSTPAAQHAAMETHGAAAIWDGDGLTVWESTQGVFFVQRDLCEALGLPSARVRVLCPFMGGGFGSKTGAGRHTILAALLSRRTGRPVRMLLDREDDFAAGCYRPGSRQSMRIGVSRDGRIEALTLRAYGAVGASPDGAAFAACESPAQDFYRCPDVRTEAYAVLTDSPPPSAFRAPGHVQGAWALEQLVDEACEELGLDPVAVRLANIAESDPVSGRPFASNGLRQCIQRGARAIGWQSRRPTGSTTGRLRRGLGMAVASWGAGGGPPATAQVAVHADGSVVVSTGACDLGTGTRTVFAQIAAEELGVPVERVLVANADTRLTPYCMPSFGSLTVASSGPAVRLAAHEAKLRLLDVAAAALGTEAGKVKLARGEARVQGRRRIAFAELAASVPAGVVIGTAERGPNPPGVVLASFAAHFVEVEVDVELGSIRVLRVVAAHDCGRILNPATWTSQVHGGILQSIGFALTERRLRDRRTGRQLNAGLLEYKVPTMADAPARIEVIDAGERYGANNINAKGAGEPPIIPTAPAIANAFANATGARIREAPMTPARVLAALEARR